MNAMILCLAGALGASAPAENSAVKIVSPAASGLVKPAVRQGYYFSANVGPFVGALKSDNRWLQTWGGAGVRLRVGQAVNTWFNLGLAIELGSISGKRRSAQAVGLAMEAQLRPSARAFVRAGLGVGVVNIVDSADPDEPPAGLFGDAYTLAIGYDFTPFGGTDLWSSGGFALAPVIGVRVQPGQENALMAAWIAIEFSYWNGLPHNQLDLPLQHAFDR